MLNFLEYVQCFCSTYQLFEDYCLHLKKDWVKHTFILFFKMFNMKEVTNKLIIDKRYMNETEKIIKICWTVKSQVCKFLGCEFALHLLRHRYRTFSKIIVQVSEAFTMCLHVYSGLFVHLSVNFLTV